MECHFCQLPVRGARGDPVGPVYCCYGCRFAAEVTRARGEGGQVNWILARLGMAVFLSMIVMMFSMYLYRAQAAVAAGEAPSESLHQLEGLMQYACLIFATPVLFILGLPILTNALDQARARVMSTDALVVLGVAAAFIYSYVATLTGRGATYYETGCAVLVFMTLGRWLEASGRLRASDAVRSLEGFFPDRVPVTREGQPLSLRPPEIQPGDLVIAPAGQRIAADGVIARGRAHVDEQLVTGESAPVAREVGDTVRAGTLSVDGELEIRATATGPASTLGRLIAILEAARRARSPYQRLAERIATAFIPVVCLIAVMAVVIGIRRGGFDDGVMSALAVLLIACPCALGIATPMAVWVALGRAARRRILLRDGETLERLARVRAVCFDKTGTLTTGDPRVVEFVVHGGDQATRQLTLSQARAATAGSTHALARAVRRYAEVHAACSIAASSVQTLPGRGLLAEIEDDAVALGSPALMHESHLAFNSHIADALEEASRRGRSVTCIGWNGQVRGFFAFDESLRPGATAAVAELQRRGLTISVLTGDHAARGRALAEAIGADVRAELLPEQKVRAIEDIRRSSGVTAMVGDGLNDAPALAAADVGIALACGADLTRESAAVCLLGDDPADIPWAIDLARATVRTIRLNLLLAFAYNAVGIGLAVTGRLSPIFAAGAMVVSSLLVIGNSLRLGIERQTSDAAHVPVPPAHGVDSVRSIPA